MTGKRDFTQYVYEFTDKSGHTRYAVAQWFPDTGQYIRPFDQAEIKAAGCTAEFARSPSGIQSYHSRKKALRRARYLFYEMDKAYCDFLSETAGRQ